MMELQTVAQFDELIKNDKVIILFTADWCPDCKVIEPFLSEIEDTFSTYTLFLLTEINSLIYANNMISLASLVFLRFMKEKKLDVSSVRIVKQKRKLLILSSNCLNKKGGYEDGDDEYKNEAAFGRKVRLSELSNVV